MKTFTATQLNKSAQEVFAAVVRDGTVIIKHDRYSDKLIVITAKEIAVDTLNVCGNCKMVRAKTASGISECCDSFFITMPRENYEHPTAAGPQVDPESDPQ